MKYWAAGFLLALLNLRLSAGDGQLPNLGSGQPGLCIIYNSPDEYVIFVDEALETSWKPGMDWSVDYRHGSMRVLTQRNFEAEKLAPNRLGGVWNTEELFAFDDQTVFTSFGDPQNRKGFVHHETRVFSAIARDILISRNVDGLARAKYGLSANQWFLGKVGTKIFYWETGKPTVVYYRTLEEKAAEHYFKLPKSDEVIEGVKKALSAEKDVGFSVIRTRGVLENISNFGTAPGQPTFVEFSFNDAQSVGN